LWLLLQDGALDVADFVANHIPEFAANGKEGVRVEHLLTHTAGFPSAPMDALEWDDPERRLARFASWRLDWVPGERFQYHATSSMWVVAELIERTSGRDFREFFRARVADALDLPDLHLGFPADHPAQVADLVEIGEPPDPEKLKASGLNISEQFTGADASVLGFNRPAIRAVGTPSGGVITNASSLALFYQGLLHGGLREGAAPVWRPETLQAGLRDRTGDLVDPMTGRLAHRALGVVLAGEKDRVFRSFAAENPPRAFGHAGLGGQVAWADPASGISFVFFTNGCDRDPVRMGGRGIALSSAAVACVEESAAA
jgi:CubicO group peptidase (beta-lactamase class C family)